MSDDPLRLSDYRVDSDRGFLPPGDPCDRLPPGFEVWEETARQLSALIATDSLRHRIESWPRLDASALRDRLTQERAMLLLSLLGNAYVWSGAEPRLKIPSALARPWCALGEALDRPPIISHASLVLHNWRRLSPERGLTLSNLSTQAQVLGGMDESWFYLVTVAIEASGAAVLPILAGLPRDGSDSSDSRLIDALERLAPILHRLTPVLQRMREQCDPYIFYRRVRPFLAGWPEPGVVYEGVWDEPRLFAGGSAAQSSLLQAIDAGLGVEHLDSRSGPFLLEMRRYMPREHREFIRRLESLPSLKEIALSEGRTPRLREGYARCIDAVENFRRAHFEMVKDYITVPAETLGESAKGTGGTAYGRFLSQAIHDTRLPERDRRH